MCISILHAPGDDPMGYESSAERWSPVQSVEKILLSVVSMLAGTGFKNNMFFGEVRAAVKSSSGIIAIEKKQVFCRENKFRRCCLFERQKYKSILLT